MESYFDTIGYPVPLQTNPAEFLLDIVSSDFSGSKELAGERVQAIRAAWTESTQAAIVTKQISEQVRLAEKDAKKPAAEDTNRPNGLSITLALLHRSFIKSYRDVVAYGIRIAMYLGMTTITISQLQRLISHRSGYHDGYRVASASSISGIHSVFYQCNCEFSYDSEYEDSFTYEAVLRLCFYVFHGCSLRAGILGRPRNLRKRKGQRAIWCNTLHDL